MKIRSVIFSLSFVMCLLWCGIASGAGLDVSSFAKIPVQEGGRELPMDTYARLRLLQFSGKSTFEKKPAVDWLARVLFTPDSAKDDKIFLVNDTSILEGIVKTEKERGRFSYSELRPGVEQLRTQAEALEKIEDKDRTPQQKEIARLYSNILFYFALTHSFGFARDDEGITITNAAVRAQMKLPVERQEFSVLDVFLRAENLAAEMQKMVSANSENWTEEQAAIFEISSLLYQISRVHRGLPMPLIPDHKGEPWLSPWDVVSHGIHTAGIREEMLALQELSRSYVKGDQAAFDAAAKEVAGSVLARVEPTRSLKHLDLELTLNKADPFYRAEIFYGLAFLVGMAAVASNRRWLRVATLMLVLIALVPHLWGMGARMVIMGRPPVTNLYATFIFVSLICVFLGLVVEAFQKNGLGSLLAAVAGLVLLLVSGRFADGDTMGVMIAVLDSNFWLSTHVISVTIGYAGCFFAGLFGAAYMIAGLFLQPNDPGRIAIAKVTYGIQAFGLIFSFLGTMLGGVWADQSWGRFWGWDPKENGALMIVLWSALLFHARIAGKIRDTGFAAGSALGIIVVLFAWLGINLLGVGLHNYGFTNALAVGFWVGVAVVLLFVVVTLPFVKRNRFQ